MMVDSATSKNTIPLKNVTNNHHHNCQISSNSSIDYSDDGGDGNQASSFQSPKVPNLPASILYHQIAPWVQDRKTWNALCQVNKEVWETFRNASTSCSNPPPWPCPKRFRVGCRAWSVAVCPSGETISCGTEHGTIHVWNCHTGQRTCLKGHEGRVNCIAYSSYLSNKVLASAGDDRTVRIWMSSDVTETDHTTQDDTPSSYSVSISSSSSSAAAASSSSSSSSSSFRCIQVLNGHVNAICSIAFGQHQLYRCSHRPNEQPHLVPMLASASLDQTIRVYRLQDSNRTADRFYLECVAIWNPQQRAVLSLAFTPPSFSTTTSTTSLQSGGIWLASGGSQEQLCVWDISTFLSKHDDDPTATGTRHPTTMVQQPLSQNDIRHVCLQGTQGDIRAVDFSRTFHHCPPSPLPPRHHHHHQEAELPLLVAFSSGSVIRIYNFVTEQWFLLKGHLSNVRSIVFGTTTTTTTTKSTANNTTPSTNVPPLLLATKTILASACTSGSIRLWHVEEGICLKKWNGHSDFIVSSLSISLNGQMLVSAGSDGTIALWNIPPSIHG